MENVTIVKVNGKKMSMYMIVKKIIDEVYHRIKFQLSKLIPDEKYIRLQFKRKLGVDINLENPSTFNEKMNWLKLYDRRELYPQLVDKYEVKRIIGEVIGDEFIIPTYGVWSDFKDIDLKSLPEQFVLKCTHDSGSVVLVDDKAMLNKEKAKRILKKSLKKNYYWYSREWVYKDVRPRIIAEKLLKSSDNAGIADYKIYCFNGEPTYILHIANRDLVSHTAEECIFDVKWDVMDWDFGDYDIPNIKPQKPQKLEEMLEICRKICRAIDVPFVRLDFYNVNDKIYFGECTFFPGAGYFEYKGRWTRKKDEDLGSLINLKK